MTDSPNNFKIVHGNRRHLIIETWEWRCDAFRPAENLQFVRDQENRAERSQTCNTMSETQEMHSLPSPVPLYYNPHSGSSKKMVLPNQLVDSIALNFHHRRKKVHVALDEELNWLETPLQYRLAPEEIMVAMPEPEAEPMATQKVDSQGSPAKQDKPS